MAAEFNISIEIAKEVFATTMIVARSVKRQRIATHLEVFERTIDVRDKFGLLLFLTTQITQNLNVCTQSAIKLFQKTGNGIDEIFRLFLEILGNRSLQNFRFHSDLLASEQLFEIHLHRLSESEKRKSTHNCFCSPQGTVKPAAFSTVAHTSAQHWMNKFISMFHRDIGIILISDERHLVCRHFDKVVSNLGNQYIIRA